MSEILAYDLFAIWVERMRQAIRRAVSHDVVSRARSGGHFEHIVMMTCSASIAHAYRRAFRLPLDLRLHLYNLTEHFIQWPFEADRLEV